MSFIDYLNKKSNISEYTTTQDDYGQQEKSWTVKISNAPTRYRRAKQEREVTVQDEAYKITIEDFVFWYEPEKNINKGDRIEVDEKAFEVITSEMDSSQHHQRVYARVINF